MAKFFHDSVPKAVADKVKNEVEVKNTQLILETEQHVLESLQDITKWVTEFSTHMLEMQFKVDSFTKDVAKLDTRISTITSQFAIECRRREYFMLKMSILFALITGTAGGFFLWLLM